MPQADGNSSSISAGNAWHDERTTSLGSWDYVDYNLLPTFLHDNEFLTRRHRPQLNSAIECLKSIFMLHSETLNIWTHVFGMALFSDNINKIVLSIAAIYVSCSARDFIF